MTTSSILKIKDQELTLVLDREELALRRQKNERVISFPLNKPIQYEGKIYPYVVFPIRITPELKLEQTSEGILCETEDQANQVRNKIALSPDEMPPVVVISWEGGFCLGTLENIQRFKRYLVLFQFHLPKVVEGQSCGFALRLYDDYICKPRVLTWEKPLPTTDKHEAEKALREKEAELRAQQVEHDRLQIEMQIEPSLLQSQLRVLSKSYPETIALFTSQNKPVADDVFKAYQRESLALFGTMVGTLDKVEFKNAARALLNASRRKNPARDAVGFELVVGWRLRGYDRMTPRERFEALRQLGLEVSSPEAVRKICERLKLPTVRKRGAPRKFAARK